LGNKDEVLGVNSGTALSCLLNDPSLTENVAQETIRNKQGIQISKIEMIVNKKLAYNEETANYRHFLDSNEGDDDEENILFLQGNH
jgi:hypothetical protein